MLVNSTSGKFAFSKKMRRKYAIRRRKRNNIRVTQQAKNKYLQC